MGIFLRQSHNVKPPRWGSFADVQYAIRVNSEKIYDCDPDDDVLVMPLFWGLPPLDYSGYNNHGTNHGATYKDGSLDFDGNDYIETAGVATDLVDNITISQQVLWHGDTGSNQLIVLNGQTGASGYGIRLDVSASNQIDILCGGVGTGDTSNALSVGVLQSLVIVRDSGVWKVYLDGVELSVTGNPIPNTPLNTVVIGANENHIASYNGIINNVCIAETVYTNNQVALMYDRPWDLYRRVARPIWSIPAVGVTIPIFMQNIRGSFNSPGTRGGFIN